MNVNFINFDNVIIDRESCEVAEKINGVRYNISYFDYDYENDTDGLIFFDSMREYLDDEVLYVYILNNLHWEI